MRRPRRHAGQSLVEMALIAPILVMLLLTVIDFGRAAYDYATLAGAVREGARAAIVTGSKRATDDQVVGQVKAYAIGLALGTGTCVNGQGSGTFLPAPTTANTGLVYVTGSSQGATPNAPAGEAPDGAGGDCAAVVPAYASHSPLTVTVEYDFQPLTPIVSQFLPSGIVMSVSTTMTTEY